jgi:ribulose-5-phosphate 4-epimerase/fuculose-1-phosphate aldolase
MHGLNEGIFNHLTELVPGKPERYYQIPFGMHWSEVKASSFMEVGIDDGKVKRGAGDVERSCYCIHAPIHKALPHAKAVFHTHMPFASALTRLENPCIKEIGQTEVGMMGMIAYDDNYTGPAFDCEEGERLAKVLGNKTVLFMANHGITTVGQSVAEAYDRLYYIERAAQVQLYAMWTGQPLKQLPEAVVETTKREIGGAHFYDGPTLAERHFCALKRILDREGADYAS